MSKDKSDKRKHRYLEHFLNFPVYVFLGIVLISIVSIFGSGSTTSQNEQTEPVSFTDTDEEDDPSIIRECAFLEKPLAACDYIPRKEKKLDLYTKIKLRIDGDKWKGGWVATAQIDKLPALKWFSEETPSGTSSADYIPNTTHRFSFGQISDPDNEEELLYYDTTKNVDGFAFLKDRFGNPLGKVQYYDGSGILINSIGNPTDTEKTFRIPEQFIISEKEYINTQKLQSENVVNNEYGFWSKIAEIDLDLLQQFLNIFKRKKCKNTPFELDGVYTSSDAATSGYESIYNFEYFDWSLEDIIVRSDILGSGCIKDIYNPKKPCKIATSLKKCNVCKEFCDKFEMVDGKMECVKRTEICDVEGNVDGVSFNTDERLHDGQSKEFVRNCIENKSPLNANQTTGGGTELILGGGGFILENYWKRVQALSTGQHKDGSPKNICHMENIGIEVKVNSTLFDMWDNFGQIPPVGISLTESCEPAGKFTPPPTSEDDVTLKAYFAYLGTAIQSSAKYIDTKETAIGEDIENLPDCEDGVDKQTKMCYCTQDQIDGMAGYLFYSGSLDGFEFEKYGFSGSDIINQFGEPADWINYPGMDDNGPILEAPEDNLPGYTGSCQEIFDQVKAESPFNSSSDVQKAQLIMDYPGHDGCQKRGTIITCDPKLVGGWCNNCPKKATNLFRHEFHHIMAGDLFPDYGIFDMGEFAADAVTDNGGWYVFKSKYSNQYNWATAIREKIIEELEENYTIIDPQNPTRTTRDIFMGYLWGSAKDKSHINAAGFYLDDKVIFAECLGCRGAPPAVQNCD